MSSTPVAVLDANVVVPAGVRDVLLSIAAAGLFVPIWQGEMEAEVLRNASRLIASRQPTLDIIDIAAKVHRTIAQMNTAFPGARLDDADWKGLVATMTNDPMDRHVLAAAVASQATHLVTENLRDFPRRSVPTPLVVPRADDFLVGLFGEHRDAVVASLERMCERRLHRPRTLDDLAVQLADGPTLPRFGALLSEGLRS